MKKYLSCAIALLSLVACQKEALTVTEPSNGSTFDLFADITKTTLNGKVVDWENGDILYLVTLDETWGKPSSEDKSGETIANFTYDGTKFSSNQTIANGSYTFHALYADESQRSYHRGASTTHKLQNVQTQDCSAPTAHIKSNDALVGKFDATTPLTAGAAVAMSHLYTIMKVDITNSTATDATINSFTMNAEGANLAGIFTVNYDKSPINVTIKQNGSSSITVNLTNGTVAKDATIPVYFVMAPLDDYSGEVTLSVTDSNDNVYTTTKTVSNLTFAPGTLNKTGFAISDENLKKAEILAKWIFTSDSYPKNATDYYATSGTCPSSTFCLNGTGSTWNSSKNSYAFTAITNAVVTIKPGTTLEAGKKITLTLDAFYNKAKNAPMTGLNLSVSSGTLNKTSWELSTTNSTYSVECTLTNNITNEDVIAFTLTQTGKAGKGEGYISNIVVTYE